MRNFSTESTATPERDVATYRPRLFGLAYRMLGSPTDADDAVQEALVRWQSIDRTSIRNPEGWLVTATTRVALDRLRALQAESSGATSVLGSPLVIEGPQATLPITPRSSRTFPLPAGFSCSSSSLLMKTAACFLHDVFPTVIASDQRATLGRTETRLRQIVHRARQRIRTGRRRFTVDPRAATALVDRFVNAFEAGDQKELQSVLAADVTQLADGGGVISVGCRPVTGLERVVRLWLGLRAKQFKSCSLAHAKVGGQPGLILRDAAGVMRGVIAIVTDQTSIVSLYVILAPDKVSRAHDRWMASGTLLCSTSSGSA